MKKIIIAISLLIFTVSIQAASATNKIGVVDVQKILRSSPKIKSSALALRKRFQPREAKLKSQGQALQKEMVDLKRNSTVMSKSQIAEKQTEIANKRNDLRLAESQFMQEVHAAQQKDLGAVIARINKAVEQVAKRGHYTLVVQRNHAVYFLPKMDITSQVLAVMK